MLDGNLFCLIFFPVNNGVRQGGIMSPLLFNFYNNNNDNNITSMALKSSEARAQKRNRTKSVIIFKSRGHTGVIISFKGPPTI